MHPMTQSALAWNHSVRGLIPALMVLATDPELEVAVAVVAPAAVGTVEVAVTVEQLATAPLFPAFQGILCLWMQTVQCAPSVVQEDLVFVTVGMEIVVELVDPLWDRVDHHTSTPCDQCRVIVQQTLILEVTQWWMVSLLTVQAEEKENVAEMARAGETALILTLVWEEEVDEGEVDRLDQMGEEDNSMVVIATTVEEATEVEVGAEAGVEVGKVGATSFAAAVHWQW